MNKHRQLILTDRMMSMKHYESLIIMHIPKILQIYHWGIPKMTCKLKLFVINISYL